MSEYIPPWCAEEGERGIKMMFLLKIFEASCKKTSSAHTPFFVMFCTQILGEISETQKMRLSSNCEYNFEQTYKRSSWTLEMLCSIGCEHFLS